MPVFNYCIFRFQTNGLGLHTAAADESKCGFVLECRHPNAGAMWLLLWKPSFAFSSPFPPTCLSPFYHSSDPPAVQCSASNALEHPTSIAALHHAPARAPSWVDIDTQHGGRVQDGHLLSLSAIALAEHPHVAADAGLGRDDAVCCFRPEISCKINDCAPLQRGRLPHSFLPVANKEAEAAGRSCFDPPRPAHDESRAPDGAAAHFYTELAVSFLRMTFLLRVVVSSVSVMHRLCAVSRSRCDFGTKWPKRQRHGVGRMAAGAVFALCVVTSPICTKSQVCRLFQQCSHLKRVERIRIATECGFLWCSFDMGGLVTCDFAGALLCVVERRRCVVLGMEPFWPGDAIWRSCFEGAVACFESGGEPLIG